MRFFSLVSVAVLGTTLFAEDLLPGYRDVKEGEVFVISTATKTGDTTSVETRMELHVDKIDRTAKTLTYSRTMVTILPGMDPIRSTMPPETVPMAAAPVPALSDPPPNVDAPKTDSVELPVKGLDGKELILKCTHGKTEVNGVTSEFWYSTDSVDAGVKCGDRTLQVHALYSKFVSDVPGVGGAAAMHSVQETWTATDDLPMFAAVLHSRCIIEGPSPADTTTKLLEIRMP